MYTKKHMPRGRFGKYRVPRYTVWLFVPPVLCIITFFCTSCHPTSPEPDKRNTHIGFTIYDFTYVNYDGEEETLTVAVWYPTTEKTHPFTYNNGFTSNIASNATPDRKNGPYPLIIFNHGLYASGIRSLPLTENLAREGFIVAAPDFTDTKPLDFVSSVATDRIKGTEGITDAQDILQIIDEFTEAMTDNREIFIDYLEKFRIGKSRGVIDYTLALNHETGSQFYGLIDENAIGMAGHSLGGLTTLGLIGKHDDINMKDERIKAALILSAPAYPFENTTNQTDIPVMVIHGEYDLPSVKPDVFRRVTYDSANAPKFYLVIKNCSHFAFSNTPCKDYDSIPECQECDSKVRVINSYSSAFFKRYLKQDLSVETLLRQQDDMLSSYEYQFD
jgi:predicted dienelactone hydrolase